MIPTALRQLGLCTIVLLLAGCSTFDHDWDAAAVAKPANAVDITGRWHGEWVSDANTHSGDLRCLIEPGGKSAVGALPSVDTSTYHARFHATYWNIFQFEYEINLTGVRHGAWVHFIGQADLGAMAGGIYHYEGNANDTNFYATYRSPEDRGKFTMRRP